jgi:alginate O-acetyltransferase complex protein AlgI
LNKVSQLVGIGVCFNLLALLVPKYWDAANEVLGVVDFQIPGGFSPWFPVGMSFFAFTQIAYLVDLSKGKVERADFLTLGTFVSFFPHMIAGPILRPAQTIRELQKPREVHPVQFERGVRLLVSGIAKKALIADPIGAYIQPLFVAIDSGTQFSSLSTWLLIAGYALQLYFDFSGYSQMAVGLAMMMGFQIPINFDAPYRSLTIIDFWKRWHISLSNFLRDYLYIPLGGSRRGSVIRYRNLLITMVLGGMWHGSTINFAVWGLLHGVFLVIAHASHVRRRPDYNPVTSTIKRVVSWSLTMLAVLIAWVPFRVGSLHTTIDTWYSMFIGSEGSAISDTSSILLPAVVGLLWIIVEPRSKLTSEIETRDRMSSFYLIWLGLVLLVSLLAQGAIVDFLYARF